MNSEVKNDNLKYNSKMALNSYSNYNNIANCISGWLICLLRSQEQKSKCELAKSPGEQRRLIFNTDNIRSLNPC